MQYSTEHRLAQIVRLKHGPFLERQHPILKLLRRVHDVMGLSQPRTSATG